MKAVLYPRVSSLKQVEGTSLESQEKACRQWCENQGVEIEMVFLEKGQSAKTADRKELQAALAYLKTRKDIDFVVVYKLDRFTRQGRDYYNLLAELAEAGCRLVSATETFDDATPAGRFMGGMLALQAQFDNEVRAERSKGGMIAAVRRGCWVWSAPTGFLTGKTENGQPTLLHDPVLAPIIRRVFEEFATGGISQEELRARAIGWGLVGMNGKPITKQSLRNMLGNPVYAARIRTKLVTGEQEGNWEPIVPADIFDRVQGVLSGSIQANKAHVKVKPEFVLKGFLFCAKCGRRLCAYKSTGRGGKRYPYYGCTACQGQSLSLAKMNAEFEAMLETMRFSEEHFEDMRKMVKEALCEAGKQAAELERARTKARERLEAEKSKLLDFLLRGTIDEATYDERLTKLRADIARVNADHERNSIEFDDIDATLRYARILLLEPRSYWAKSNNGLKIQIQSLWCPGGIVFDKSREPRTRLLAKAPTSYDEVSALGKVGYPART